jgi:hypothetical protein
MKPWLFAASAMLLAFSALAPMARADDPRQPPQNYLPGPDAAASSVPASTAHYVWQQGYERSGEWRGHWVLVR